MAKFTVDVDKETDHIHCVLEGDVQEIIYGLIYAMQDNETFEILISGTMKEFEKIPKENVDSLFNTNK